MGYEYRLHVEPGITDLDEACSSAFAESDFQVTPSSLLERPGSIGIQLGAVPDDPEWPQVADLYLEDPGTIYIVCHNQAGGLFMNALVDALRAKRHSVEVDDDI